MKLTVAFIYTTICLSNVLHFGNARFIDEKPLHDRMTDKEIRHFFGVETRSSVPEYEVTHPFESNNNGHFVSYSLNGRRKRSVTTDHNNDIRYYKIDAFGEQLHLELKRNTKFMAPGLQLEKREKNGKITKTQVSRDSYFRGNVISDPGSFVALSVNDGLTGMIRGSRDTYSVHPLPTHLAQHFKTARDAMPHVVYKAPWQQDSKWESNASAGKHFISVTKRDDESAYQEHEHSINDEGQTSEKYLEAAILAEEQIADFHGNKTEEYLLLIASIADEIFQDATIGEIKINYVVTRLVVVTDQELGFDPANSLIGSIGILNKLASWARRNNKPRDSDPEQFDVASLLLSRQKGGLAALGGMCYQNKHTGARKMDVVNLNGDNGFQTAYTIVHEIGHNLGLGHDGKNCRDGVNIMAKVLGDGPGSLEWSPCSREKIQTFLRNPYRTCLDDAPPPPRPRLPDSFYTELPGHIVDGDEQCRAQHASQKFKQCQQKKSNCASLYCTSNGYTCYSRYLRPLDGTSCGLRKWCIKGFCVDDGTNIPPKIDGGWSHLSGYKPCTPSCEGGVRYRERTCTNPAPKNGGQGCVGSSIKSWEICNAEVKCNSSEPSFRHLQCTEKDSQSWPHYPKGANPCILTCRRSNYYRFYGKVISGTRCYRDKTVYDVCIDGECQAVGCDKVLGSGKMKDRCGSCGGNGDRCRFVKARYTKNYKNSRIPDTIVHLPPNSSNVLFKERASSWNVIGIQDENETYLIRIPSWTNKVVYKAGTKIAYFNWYHFPDRLEIEGPTNMALNVMFVNRYRKPNVGIDYQYFRPLLSNETAVAPTCHWISSSWSRCSETGKQTREVRCVRSDDQSPANNNCCEEATKPASIKPCHKISQWHVSDWLPCSKTCGNGIESRSVTCRAKFNKTHFEVIADSFCNSTIKPISVVSCNEIKCPAHWKSSPWSACSTVCLPGNRTRDVKCIRTSELGKEERVADIRCEYEPKPPTNEMCNDENPCKKLDIGCFKTPEGTLSQIGDFTQEPDPDLAVANCGELAHYHGFQVFALGKGGLCLSGAEAKHRYHKHGTVPKHQCPFGIGKESNSFVYSFDPVPTYKPLGCFKDRKNARALPDRYASFRSYIIWSDIETSSIRRCASVARDKGYEYFAVQFYGECFSSKDAGEKYDMYGRETSPKKCPTRYANVGGPSTNFVYRFSQVIH